MTPREHLKRSPVSMTTSCSGTTCDGDVIMYGTEASSGTVLWVKRHLEWNSASDTGRKHVISLTATDYTGGATAADADSANSKFVYGTLKEILT